MSLNDSSSFSTAVITGAGGGIGGALCTQLAERGATVLAGVHRTALATSDPKVVPIPLDLADPASVEQFAQRVRAEAPAIDLVVNCAGANRATGRGKASVATLEELDGDALAELAHVNAIGPTLLAGRLAGHLAPHAVIVNVTTQRAAHGDALDGGGKYGYRGTKAALEVMTAALAADLAPRGVRVLLVDPGWVRTSMGGDDAPDDPMVAASELLALARRGDVPTGRVVMRSGAPVSR